MKNIIILLITLMSYSASAQSDDVYYKQQPKKDTVYVTVESEYDKIMLERERLINRQIKQRQTLETLESVGRYIAPPPTIYYNYYPHYYTPYYHYWRRFR